MLYNKNNLLAYELAHKENTKPELNSVLFEKEKTIATDSYCLLEVKNNFDLSEMLDNYPQIPNEKVLKNDFAKTGYMIPVGAVKKAYNNLKEVKNKDLPILQYASLIASQPKSIKIACTDLIRADIVNTRLTEGHYPDYKQSMPANQPKQKITINLQYLKKVINTLSKMENLSPNDDNPQITVNIRDENTPLEIKAHTKNQTQDITALVMPIRDRY